MRVVLLRKAVLNDKSEEVERALVQIAHFEEIIRAKERYRACLCLVHAFTRSSLRLRWQITGRCGLTVAVAVLFMVLFCIDINAVNALICSQRTALRVRKRTAIK